MGEVPPRSVQLRFILKLQKETKVAADLWEHAVSKEWVAELHRFVEDEDSGRVTIPPMSASDWDDNNIYIGEKNWKVLASWYGLDRKYSFRRRSIVSTYVGIVNNGTANKENYVFADAKMDFITAFCCLLKDLSSEQVKRPYVNIYFWESLYYIEFQLRCSLRVHPEKDVRLWMSLCDDGKDVFLEDLSGYDRIASSVGSVLCERLPQLLEMLQTRQMLPASRTPQVYPGVTSVKEELSSIFITNQWQLMLCLEELPKPLSSQPEILPARAIPQAFLNLTLDHLFSEPIQTSDYDEELVKVLDSSEQELNSLITDHRNKVEARIKQLLDKARESYAALEEQLATKLNTAAERESRLNTREKELNERDQEINKKLAKFKSMLTEFLTKKDRFEKDCERMADQNRITFSRVELNVGGVRYTTSISTMLKEEGSLLHTMFSGQHALKPDADGSYFIDRDGTQFRFILNFLRDGSASLQHLSPSDMRLLSEVRTEAEHYQLYRLVDALRLKMKEGSGGDFASMPT